MVCFRVPFILLVFAVAVQLKITHHPTNFALWNLASVAKCMLGYYPLNSLQILANYGCYCGLGGGHRPVDKIDEYISAQIRSLAHSVYRCCMRHDQCYGAAQCNECKFYYFFVYVINYSWKCINGQAYCSEKQDPCRRALCNCDVEVVKCWNKHGGIPLKRAKCYTMN
ncbi:unnamed protein product [Strongylus vulgaris]|uniref:Phospholipase A2-like central domain-containing protein n=1 Tax=Strongylus vulgaris TaxID=40348 RepID=A0A3P7JCY3_STRVU|nr:unnamed protein product [Strongylus vulgaris]